MNKNTEKAFELQGRQQPRYASLMARIRALVSNSPCNISHFTAYITFATEKMHQLLVFYVLYISKINIMFIKILTN